jgi:hypothetical protein
MPILLVANGQPALIFFVAFVAIVDIVAIVGRNWQYSLC